ncbi:uncharacterized protein LOC143292151 [Babylonia areolata]|uniref:uncharacterized protein LOC143292151 n=1 Tax=Babylonia areolata TaxID=304850 RepID=UPI003FD0DA0C
MSKYRELELLKEQEMTLQKLHMSFNDQLNRLKVEELALTNLLRLQKEREMSAQTGATQEGGRSEETIEQETMEVLNLLVSDKPEDEQVEEEEEEEEEEEGGMGKEDIDDDGDNEESSAYNEQLATYLEDLFQQQQEQNQDRLLLTSSQEEELQEVEEEEEEET